jgi:hypothetical protein
VVLIGKYDKAQLGTKRSVYQNNAKKIQKLGIPPQIIIVRTKFWALLPIYIEQVNNSEATSNFLFLSGIFHVIWCPNKKICFPKLAPNHDFALDYPLLL